MFGGGRVRAVAQEQAIRLKRSQQLLGDDRGPPLRKDPRVPLDEHHGERSSRRMSRESRSGVLSPVERF